MTTGLHLRGMNQNIFSTAASSSGDIFFGTVAVPKQNNYKALHALTDFIDLLQKLCTLEDLTKSVKQLYIHQSLSTSRATRKLFLLRKKNMTTQAYRFFSFHPICFHMMEASNTLALLHQYTFQAQADSYWASELWVTDGRGVLLIFEHR